MKCNSQIIRLLEVKGLLVSMGCRMEAVSADLETLMPCLSPSKFLGDQVLVNEQ